MSHDGFSGHSIYRNGEYECHDDVCSGMHHSPDNCLTSLVVNVLGFKLFKGGIIVRPKDAALRLYPNLFSCSNSNLAGHAINSYEHFSCRFLRSVFVVCFIWGALAGWLTIVQALQNVVFGNALIAAGGISKEAPTSPIGTSQVLQARYGIPTKEHSIERSPSLKQQSFNPAFGSARIDAPVRRYLSNDVIGPETGRYGDDECMTGQISLPSQVPSGTEKIPVHPAKSKNTSLAFAGSRLTLAQQPSFVSPDYQNFLANLQNEKPKAKIIITSR